VVTIEADTNLRMLLELRLLHGRRRLFRLMAVAPAGMVAVAGMVAAADVVKSIAKRAR
jgi:hypothetical protein